MPIEGLLLITKWIMFDFLLSEIQLSFRILLPLGPTLAQVCIFHCLHAIKFNFSTLCVRQFAAVHQFLRDGQMRFIFHNQICLAIDFFNLISVIIIFQNSLIISVVPSYWLLYFHSTRIVQLLPDGFASFLVTLMHFKSHLRLLNGR